MNMNMYHIEEKIKIFAIYRNFMEIKKFLLIRVISFFYRYSTFELFIYFLNYLSASFLDFNLRTHTHTNKQDRKINKNF